MILLAVLILVILSGFFSFAEASIVASDHIKLKSLMNSNKKINYIIKNKKDYLGSIIIANTIVNISGSMIIGGLITKEYNSETIKFLISFLGNDFNFSFSNINIILIINIAVTYLILVFAEMIPKFLASTHPEKTLIYINFLLYPLKFIMIPFLFLTKGLFSFFIKDNNVIEKISKEEVESIIYSGINSGIFNNKESNLLKNTIKLSDNIVSDVITPDYEIEYIDENLYINDIINDIFNYKHQKIITLNNNNNITGIVSINSILKNYILKNNKQILEIKKDPVFINSYDKMIDLFNKLDLSSEHIILVVDTNEIVSIVSTNDILHKLVS